MNNTISSNSPYRPFPPGKVSSPFVEKPSIFFGSQQGVVGAQAADRVNILKPKRPEEPHTAQNIVWVSTERLPAKEGGLGEVSKTIPEAISEHLSKKDVRIIVPYLKEHRKEDTEFAEALKKSDKKTADGREVREEDIFQPTGLTLEIEHKRGRSYNVEVLQKFELASGLEGQKNAAGQPYGNWIYALRCDDLFIGKNKKNEEVGLAQYTYNPDAGKFDKVMFFNKAAAALIPLLDGKNNNQKANGLKKFDNAFKDDKDPSKQAVDVVVAHDWLSGPVLSELEADKNTKKVFMVHNKYDEVQTPNVSERLNLVTPARLYSREENYSALRMGIEPADAIIVNDNFLRTLVDETHLANDEPYVQSLRQKHQEGRTFTMHHGLSATFNPTGVKDDKGKDIKAEAKDSKALDALVKQKQQALAKLKKEKLDDKSRGAIYTLEQEIEAFKSAALKGGYQFEYLKVAGAKPTVQEMQAFKAANKKALQRKLGLKEDPNAIIFGWAARLEPRQKGFYLLQKSMEDILANHKNAQFVIFGPNEDPAINQWIEQINEKYGQPDDKRVYIPKKFAAKEEVLQLNSASDFTVLPSIYEPYGLTQLEAMKMGSIPIVNAVDGLKTTVNDPVVVKKYRAQLQGPKKQGEAVWKKPQNGFLMAPFNIDDYSEYVNARMSFEDLTRLYKKVQDPKEANKKATHVGDFSVKLKATAERYRHLIKMEQSDIRRDPKKAPQAEAKIKALQAKIADVEKLSQQVAFQKDVSPALFDEIKQLIGPDEDLQKREAAKLTEAMERGIALIQSKGKQAATQMRLNGLHFVNTDHAWSTLVKNYYKSVFENSTLDEASRARHTEEVKAFRALRQAKKVAESAVKYVNERKSDMVEASKNLGTQILSAFKSFWIAQSKFWEAIGRFFSLRKD